MKSAQFQREHLVRMARGQARAPYPRGVSLMALLAREAGRVEVRHKPVQFVPDYFDPVAASTCAVFT